MANVFSQSIQRVIEEDGILSAERGDCKLAAVFNMDQTAIYIDMAGKTTVDFAGNTTIDVLQGIYYCIVYFMFFSFIHFWRYR